MLLPIPQQKLHNTSHLHHYYNDEYDHQNGDYDCNEYVEPQQEHADFHNRNLMKFDKIMLTKRDNQLTPEVLLSPHYFNNRRIYSKYVKYLLILRSITFLKREKGLEFHIFYNFK